MLYIAVCDDEKNIGAELESFLLEILKKRGIEHQIDVYFSGSELFRAIQSTIRYDLVFLDIEYAQDEINGVQVGRQIRDSLLNHLTSIVYISWESSYALELFETQPLNFLIKPLSYEKIDHVVRKHLQISGHRSKDFVYKVGHDTFKVIAKDIVYLESMGRMLILHKVEGNTVEFYGSIKAAYEEQLKKCDFIQIHNSYVVNYDYIHSMKIDQVHLVDNIASLPISKHRRGEVKEKFFQIMNRKVI